MIWRGQQRAIGEVMIKVEDRRPHCRGYADSYTMKEEAGFPDWFEPLRPMSMQLRGNQPSGFAGYSMHLST
jgi:hypothetical protein